jgi:scyllo-inositol 2-dehydrogenase (NADP+)
MGARRLRVGIAGAGWVAQHRHVPVVLSRHDAELAAVYDRDVLRAQSLIEQATGRRGAEHASAHDDLGTFLGQGLDAVHVTTSPWSHGDIAVAALSAGAHVLVEKPMAMNSAEAAWMAEGAAAAGRLLCVCHNFLWSSSMANALHQLGGRPVRYVLGLQMSAATRRLPSWHRELPGGLMFDEIPHMLYSASALLGGHLEVDHARAAVDNGSGSETVEVLLRGRRGRGEVTMVSSSPVSEWHVLAVGEASAVHIDLFRDTAVGFSPDGAHGGTEMARTSLFETGGYLAGLARSDGRWAVPRKFSGHDALIGRFYEAVLEGRPPPVPVEEALGVVAATDVLLSAVGAR